MSEVVKIGNVEARRGEKKVGFLVAGETAVTNVSIPVAVINGIKPGSTLCVSAGVHGCEYTSIEAVIRMIRQTDPMKLNGTLLAVPVLNMAGFETRGPSGGISTPYHSPYDSINPLSAFTDNPRGSIAYQIASVFMIQIVSKADYYIDCHGGDINEEMRTVIMLTESGDPDVDKASREVLAASFDCDYVEIHPRPTRLGGGTTGAAGRMRKPSMVVEAGGYGQLMEHGVRFLVEGVSNVMKRLKMIEGEPAPPSRQRICQKWNLYARRGGVCYTVPLGRKVKEGEKVGEVRSIFGELLETIQSPVDGVVVYRRVPIPVATNDRILGILPDEDMETPFEYSHPSTIMSLASTTDRIS